MNIKTGMVFAFMFLMVGCSSAPTYQVPDYYETKTIPYHYRVGEVNNLNALRPSYQLKHAKQYSERSLVPLKLRKDKGQTFAKGQWIRHRAYKQQYFLE